MRDHLSDDQFDSLLLAEDDAAATQHLAGCEVCRRDLKRMRAVLTGARAESLARAERPYLFWREQRMAIASRLTQGHEITTRPLAWAGSLAVCALVAAFLTQSAPPVQPGIALTQGSPAVAATVDPDHELLLDIQRSVRRDVPRALEPASLIAQELHRAANKSDR